MDIPEQMRRALISLGFIAEDYPATGQALTGGVASDIWRVEIPGQTVCVKRALEQLRVSREWRVSVDRNAFEVAWFNTVVKIVPESVPKILGHDPAGGIFIMEFLPPEDYRVWKSQLLEGCVDLGTPEALAGILAQIHRATAGDETVARQFDHDQLFHSLRLEPYLHATAELHSDLAPQLFALAAMVVANKRVLVHGDISPKNILVGAKGPIIIDAECAWYGDPAFDLAFCLNHLLLKSIAMPGLTAELVACFEVLQKTYLREVDWESGRDLEGRVAQLLPGLMLGRIDGKSPVEYICEEREKNRVRRFARRFLLEPVEKLSAISASWQAEV